MTEFPKGVRLAQHGDERRLFDLCCIAHGENGWGILDPNLLRVFINKAVRKEGIVFAIIDGPERIEATLGLQPVKPWYCSDDSGNWYWTELGICVHPLHRRSRHAVKLVKFAHWWAAKTHMPVSISILPLDGDLERKDKLFSRYAKRVGSTFIFGNTSISDHKQQSMPIAGNKCAA